MDKPRTLRRYLFYPSALVLVVSNLLVLAGALFWGWNLAAMLLLYWAESGIIGFYNILKMALAKNITIGTTRREIKLEGSFKVQKIKNAVKIEGPAKLLVKAFLICFFCVHYSGFMAVHFVFLLLFVLGPLLAASSQSLLDFTFTVVLGLLVLFASHGFSFYTNYLGNKEYEKENVVLLMGWPYARLMLMHCVVLLGALSFVESLGTEAGLAFSMEPVILLVVGKTVIDLVSHIVERKRFGSL